MIKNSANALPSLWIDRSVPRRQWKKMKWNDECRLNLIRPLIYPTLVILCVFLHNCILLGKNLIPTIIINHAILREWRGFQKQLKEVTIVSYFLFFQYKNWSLNIIWDHLSGHFTKILSYVYSSPKKTLCKPAPTLSISFSSNCIGKSLVFHHLIGRSITERAAGRKIHRNTHIRHMDGAENWNWK